MGVISCPVCKGDRTVSKPSKTVRGVAVETSKGTKPTPCPECGGKGYKVIDKIW